MPHFNYPTVINENERELEKLEKRHDEPARLRSLTGFAWWTEAVDALSHQ
jgi:hypothetical protein